MKNKKSLIQRLLPTTRKSQIFSTVFIFAVIGAVIVYTSFATAYLGPWIYNRANHNLIERGSGGCSIDKSSDPYVFKLYCPKTGVSSNPSFAKTYAYGGVLNYDQRGLYQYCAYVKGTGWVTMSGGMTTGGTPGTGFHYVNNSSYTPICTTFFWVTDASRVDGYIKITEKDGGNITISSILLQHY